MRDQRQRVRDEGPERRYFSMIPHLVTDMADDPVSFNALGLYVYYKRWCGEHGEGREESIRTTAQRLGLSIGRIYAAQQELVRRGLIHVAYEGSHGHERAEITIEDVWESNMRAYHVPSQRRSTIERNHGRPRPAGETGAGVQLSNAASGNSGAGVHSSVQKFDEFPDALSLTGKNENVKEKEVEDVAQRRDEVKEERPSTPIRTIEPPRPLCSKCGAHQDEPALPKCGNPIWHMPRQPASEAV